MADDNELMEVDIDASEVEQVVPVKTCKCKYWYDSNGGLCCVWVKLEYSDGSKTNGYVTSTFLDDSKEGLYLLRAYINTTIGQKVLSTCRGLKTVRIRLE